jgi:hypothetical protein
MQLAYDLAAALKNEAKSRFAASGWKNCTLTDRARTHSLGVLSPGLRVEWQALQNCGRKEEDENEQGIFEAG